MQVKVTSKDFGYTTKYLKKNGYNAVTSVEMLEVIQHARQMEVGA